MYRTVLYMYDVCLVHNLAGYDGNEHHMLLDFTEVFGHRAT